jgi:uncharacterized phiE125 gp8 family phage protein
MALTINTAPTIEPITRDELRTFLRLDTTDNTLDSQQTIRPAEHAIIAAYGLVGETITVGGSNATVYLHAGDCTGSTVTVKLQESNDGIAWTDVTSGAFTVVTAANDNATQEKEYTGGYTYLRAVATVAVAVADFSVTVVLQTQATLDDDFLDECITAGRLQAEAFSGWTLIDTVWTLTLDSFPTDFELPHAPLDSVTSIKYYDENNAQQTLAAAYYQVDTLSVLPRIKLNDGYSWPTTYDKMNAVEVIFKTGYGTLTTDVPKNKRMAVMFYAADMYENRTNQRTQTGRGGGNVLAAERLLWPDRIFTI